MAKTQQVLIVFGLLTIDTSGETLVRKHQISGQVRADGNVEISDRLDVSTGKLSSNLMRDAKQQKRMEVEPDGNVQMSDQFADLTGQLLPSPVRDLKQQKDTGGLTGHVGETINEGSEDLKRNSPGSNLEVHQYGDEAVVLVTYSGETQQYDLIAGDIYANDATTVYYTAEGVIEEKPTRPNLLLSQTQGRRASAQFLEDGSISGLFELGDRILEIRPGVMDKQPKRGMSLITSSGNRGSMTHFMGFTPSLREMGRKLNVSVMAEEGGEGMVSMTGPDLEVENEKDWQEAYGAAPNMADNHDDTWGGTAWWPGCYSGDSNLHDFVVGVAVDPKGAELLGHELLATIEQQFIDASFVYEKQMHIKLKLGNVQIARTSHGAPSWAAACKSSGADMGSDKLEPLRDWSQRPKEGAWHLFTGCTFCANRLCTMGLGWLGTICHSFKQPPFSWKDKVIDSGAVSRIHRNEIWGGLGSWVLFAHELGHNFGAHHSFEDGEKKTGGIMDYGDGYLNGEYQFNTKYRKAEVCRKLNNVVNKCGSKFKKDTLYPWHESLAGTDLKSGEWTGSKSTSLDACKRKANRAKVKYFAWTGQIYGGYCKVMKSSVISPNLLTHQGYGYKLWEDMRYTKPWRLSKRGTDLASGQWTGYAYTSLSRCKAKADAHGTAYLAWTGQVYGGYCKVLKPGITCPNLDTHQGYGYLLYKNLQQFQKSTRGRDLAPGQWDGSVSTSLALCKDKAMNAKVRFFAWTSKVYGGYCKVLKPGISNPRLNTHQGYGYELYENIYMTQTC